MGGTRLWVVGIAGAAMALTGTVVLAKGLRSRAEGRRMRGWPTVTGKVIASGSGPAAESVPVRREDVPRTGVRYAYRVDGKPYEGERVRFGPGDETPGTHELAQIAARYPVGSRVLVRYDPTQHANAALEPPPTGRTAVLSLLGAASLAVGMLAVVISLVEANAPQ